MTPPILSLALPSETGRVLSIQSHTVQGYVGNKSAVFPLQLLGYDVDPINSVQFSNHTGYPTFKGQVLNGQQLCELIEGLESNDLLYYTHLLTGYIGSVSFLSTVLEVVNKLRSINPKLRYVCDPVMGDEGKLYVPPELVSVYREKVVPVASMLTPNQFEAELLTNSRIESETDGREACNILHAAGPSMVVITSININGILLLIGSHQKEQGLSPEQFKIVIPKIPAYFTGTGDLTTALLLGWSNKYPDNLDKAAELAVSSLQISLPIECDCMADIWGALVQASPWIIGLVIPLILGGNFSICRKAFEMGMAVGVFLFYKTALAAIVLLLTATIAKIDRPPLTLPVFFRVLHLAVLEPLVDQLCLYAGLRYTIGTFSSSMVACGPALIFVAACFCGMEYVQWSARSFRAKVLGTTVMVGGGCIVGFYQGPSISLLYTPTGNQIELDAREIRENWVRGPLLVLIALAAMVWYNIEIKKVTLQYGSPLWLTIYR